MNFPRAKTVAMDPAWREDFSHFITTLHKEQGFEIFHIMVHSMGCRLSLNMAETFPDLFELVGEDGEHPDFKTSVAASLDEQGSAGYGPYDRRLPAPAPPGLDPNRKPRLMSMIYLNGEGSIDTFRKMFPIIRSVCPIVTAYGDRGDWALVFSQIINGGEKMVGRNLETLYVEPKDYNRMKQYFDIENGTESGTLKSGEAVIEMEQVNKEQEQEEARRRRSSGAGQFLERVQRKYFDMVSRSERWRGKWGLATDRSDLLSFLFKDVISTEFLQTNVQALRHVYFQFNRQFMDDLREIIVEKKRARYRQNLTLKEGNVYGFLNVPPYVMV